MFNTSGYLFTEEMLEYLSNYTTNFVLSVDGNEKLTNYFGEISRVFVNYFNEEISEEEAKKTINDIYKNIIPLNYLLIELDKIYGSIYVKDLYKYAKHIFDNK